VGFYHDFLLFSAKYGGWAQKPAKIDQKNAIFWLSAQEKKKIYNSGRPPALGPRIAQEKKFFSPTQLYSAGKTVLGRQFRQLFIIFVKKSIFGQKMYHFLAVFS